MEKLEIIIVDLLSVNKRIDEIVEARLYDRFSLEELTAIKNQIENFTKIMKVISK
jgi:hypothetical protein